MDNKYKNFQLGRLTIGQVYVLYVMFLIGSYLKKNPDATSNEITNEFTWYNSYSNMEYVIKSGNDENSSFFKFLTWYVNTPSRALYTILYVDVFMKLPPDFLFILECARRFGKTELWLIISYYFFLIDWKTVPEVETDKGWFQIRFFYNTQELGEAAFETLQAMFDASGVYYKPSMKKMHCKSKNTKVLIRFVTVKSDASAVGRVIHQCFFDEAHLIENLASFIGIKLSPTTKGVKALFMSSTSYDAKDLGFATFVKDSNSYVLSMPKHFNPLWLQNAQEFKSFEILNKKPS